MGAGEFFLGNLLNKAYWAANEDCRKEIERILEETERKECGKTKFAGGTEEAKEAR